MRDPTILHLDQLSWRERSTWRMARTRHLERLEQGMREALERLVEGRDGPDPLLASLQRIEQWCADLRGDCADLAAVREGRITLATPTRPMPGRPDELS